MMVQLFGVSPEFTSVPLDSVSLSSGPGSEPVLGPGCVPSCHSSQPGVTACKEASIVTGERTELFPLVVTLFTSFFFFFRAVPLLYRGSQARGQIGATAAILHHSHINLASEPFL